MSRSGGWDIRLQCTVCGFRHRKNRFEGTDGGVMGHEPPATVETVCSNCNAEAGYPDPEIKTKHFVDIASDIEMRAYTGFNQKPKCEPLEYRESR